MKKKADQKRSTDRKSRYVSPKKVAPMIYDLINDNSNDAYYVLQTIDYDGATTHYIALIIEDKKAFFVDSTIPHFVSATVDSFKDMEFWGIFKCWKVVWNYVSPEELRKKKKKDEDYEKKLKRRKLKKVEDAKDDSDDVPDEGDDDSNEGDEDYVPDLGVNFEDRE